MTQHQVPARLLGLRVAVSLGLSAVLAVIVVLAGGCAGDWSYRPTEKPNLLLLVIDCLRADHVGVNGYERETTPYLDRLAAEGVNFTRAFSQSQWTRPSVPTLLTGLYPAEHGLVSLPRGKRRSAGAALAPGTETLAEALKAHGYRTALFARQAQLSPHFGLTQGFDVYRSEVPNAQRINGKFLEWAADRNEEPFFAYLHYLEVHWPYCPPGTTKGRFDPGTSDLAFCSGARKLKADIRSGKVELSTGDVDTMVARYDEELAALDAVLGHLFLRLKRVGLWDESLIAVTSDHGEQFYERGTIGHNAGLFDELIRVPLIVKTPSSWKIPTGASIETLVELRDVAPTFLHAAGLPVEGRHSLLPWIFGHAEAVAPRRYVVAESSVEIAVRTEDLKLIVARESEQVKLFDLTADPGETTNLASSRRVDLALLRTYLEEWQEGLEPVEAVPRELNEKTIESLKALGYLD